MVAYVDPYNRIRRAAAAGRGVRLSADEVRALWLDDAIEMRAAVLLSEPDQWLDQLHVAGVDRCNHPSPNHRVREET